MSYFVYAFLSIFLLIGLGFIANVAHQSWKGHLAASWPQTYGELVSCEFKTFSDSDGDTYQVEVRYQYRVGEQTFENDVLGFGYNPSSGRSGHQQIYQKLASAKAVRVFYNPTNPQESTLIAGFDTGDHFALIFGLMFTILASGLMLFFYTGKALNFADKLLVQ